MIQGGHHDTYVTEYDNMHATSLTREMHERTCGYWYTITNGAVAHTAFRTWDDMDAWLAERGLTAALGRNSEGKYATSPVFGSYRTSLDRNADRFAALEPIITTAVWDNGERVPAKITENAGVRTVHYMNVNYR